MFKKRSRFLNSIASFFATWILFMSIAGFAYADSPKAVLVIVPGQLRQKVAGMTINNNNSIEQNGKDQLLPIKIWTPVTDATGTGAGWKVTLKGTTFSDGDGHILNNMPTVSGVILTPIPDSTSTMPENTTSYTNYTVPTGIASTLFNAPVNTGMGQFTLTTTMNLKIQSTDIIATYTGTLTFAIVSGPQ